MRTWLLLPWLSLSWSACFFNEWCFNLCVSAPCRYNEKYNKDLVATKKRLSEAQSRITVLEKQVRAAG
jgi:hypothetical protein